MKKLLFLTFLLTSSLAITAEELKTPADLTDEEQAKMFQLITAYNSCNMQTRLQKSQTGHDAQAQAQTILESCESHLDDLKLHLTSHDIDEPLAEGMAKKLRSKAARQLMTKTMNNLAAQAAAMQNAEKVQ